MSLAHALRGRTRLFLRTLEDRSVPASLPGTLASFPVLYPSDQAPLEVVVRRSDFALPAGRVLLSFRTYAAQDETLDPPAVTLTRGSAGVVRTLVSLDNVAGGSSGLTVAATRPGTYSVRLPAGVTGRCQLDVSLAGDANGDFRVGLADLKFIRSRVGAAIGESRYRAAADVDGDGVITRADLGLARRNLGARTAVRPLVLAAGLSPDSDPDGNGIVLQPTIDLVGQARPRVTIHGDLDADGTIDMTARTQSAGRFRLGLTLSPGPHKINLTASDGFGQTATASVSVALGDVVLDWNAVHLTAIRDYTTLSQVPYPDRIVHTAPPLAARNLAMVHAAMYDAVNAVERTGRPYYVDLVAPGGTSAIAAAASAAHRVLTALYPKPEQLGLFDAALRESLAAVTDSAGAELGKLLGWQVADAILAWRSTDGSKTPVTYTPGTEAGDWQLTGPAYLPPLLPQWPAVMPFGVPDVFTFRPPPPPDLTSTEYAAALNEVKELGRFDSSTRTAEQTEIAIFWADGPGTATPPGHWNRIAAEVALQRGSTLAENARLFALLNIAMADAGIACWDAKYHYELWRPITAIREAELDGIDLTSTDADWFPLLNTPPFPTYTSGHSTFSGAAAAVLTNVFGPAVSFTTWSDGLDGFTQRPLPAVFSRTFASFEAAAEEAGRSRVYGGIHFEFDNSAGLTLGQLIGNYVSHKFV